VQSESPLAYPFLTGTWLFASVPERVGTDFVENTMQSVVDLPLGKPKLTYGKDLKEHTAKEHTAYEE